jgi:peptide/nickel transport system permease protein
MVAGEDATQEAIEQIRVQYGFDRPLYVRFFEWIGQLVTGDFGTSYTYRTPVIGMVEDRLWVSLPLALYALVLSTALAFPAGIFAAANAALPIPGTSWRVE